MRRILSRLEWFLRTGTNRQRACFRLLRSILVLPHLAKRKKALALLPPAKKCIPASSGVLTLAPHSLRSTKTIETDSQNYLQQNSTNLDNYSNRPYASHPLPESFVHTDSAFFDFALDTSLISTVSAYLGMVPVLRRIELWHVAQEQSNQKPFGSQLYHCDDGDLRQVKVFVYLSDVSKNDGPLTILDAEVTRQAQKACRFRYRDHLSDAQVFRLIGKHHEQCLAGAAGTTLLVDTSRCMHYGSRMFAPENHRFSLYFQYMVPGAFKMPLNFRQHAPYRHLASNSLSDIQNMVLGAI
jgi:hypothetical protein